MRKGSRTPTAIVLCQKSRPSISRLPKRRRSGATCRKETPWSVFQAEGWDTKQSHSWLSDGRYRRPGGRCEGLSGLNSQVTVPELCHVCSLRPEMLSHLLSNSEPMKWTSPRQSHLSAFTWLCSKVQAQPPRCHF